MSQDLRGAFQSVSQFVSYMKHQRLHWFFRYVTMIPDNPVWLQEKNARTRRRRENAVRTLPHKTGRTGRRGKETGRKQGPEPDSERGEVHGK